MSNIHFTDPYILNPQHKITIHLVGTGGTGSQVLSGLARLHKGLQALNHTGIHVRAFDPDKVSAANIGRQMFSPADIDINKAVIAVSRINRFFGYNWEAYDTKYNASKHPANIIITCVDTAKARTDINNQIDEIRNFTDPLQKPLYWLDFGNQQKTGQVVLGSISPDDAKNKTRNTDFKNLPTVLRLPCITDLFDLTKVKEKAQGPSCSLAEAIGRQDLFINSTLANLGCNLLWKLFTQGKLTHHGLYLNLETMQVRPINVPQKKSPQIIQTKKPLKQPSL